MEKITIHIQYEKNKSRVMGEYYMYYLLKLKYNG